MSTYQLKMDKPIVRMDSPDEEHGGGGALAGRGDVGGLGFEPMCAYLFLLWRSSRCR